MYYVKRVLFDRKTDDDLSSAISGSLIEEDDFKFDKLVCFDMQSMHPVMRNYLCFCSVGKKKFTKWWFKLPTWSTEENDRILIMKQIFFRIQRAYSNAGIKYHKTDLFKKAQIFHFDDDNLFTLQDIASYDVVDETLEYGNEQPPIMLIKTE